MSNESILVLLDHPELRDKTHRILAGTGYRVTIAASGAQAIAAAHSECFDLLLADLHLPDVSGLEAFHKIRASQPGLAGIIVTDAGTWETAKDAVHDGACGLLVKPFLPEQLVAAVVNAIEREKLAHENARLSNQLCLLSDMSQSIARAVDLDEAIAAIVAAPARLANATGAVLWLIEGALEPKIAQAQGVEEAQIPALARDQIAERYSEQQGGGWLTLPLQQGEKLLGALCVRLDSPQAPDEKRLGLLRTLAHAASASIESHRLRAREVSALREVDRALRSDLSVRQLLERLLDQMTQACAAENGSIFLWNPEHDRVDAWVTTGAPPREEYAWVVIREGRAGNLSDVHAGSENAIGAPMRVGSRVEGAVILTRAPKGGPFARRQIDLLSTLTSSAALIVRNTELYARSEEAAIAEERTRIAREIHDGLAQDLSFLVLKASAAQKLLGRGEEQRLQRELREISDQLRQEAREVRRVIFALRPPDIETLGLIPALDKFIKEFAQANDIEVLFEVCGEGRQLPPKLETAVFRLVQEALNNVRKHAHASQARVELQIQKGGWVGLQVRDNGRGFEVEGASQAARARGSVGLIQMQERAERAGGLFKVESAAGQGTRIQVELPIREW